MALPRLRFGWTVVIALAVSLGLGAVAGLWAGDPPVPVMLVLLGWLFPGLPAILVWSAVREARSMRKAWFPGLVLALMGWVFGALLLFVPMSDGTPDPDAGKIGDVPAPAVTGPSG